MDGQPSLLSTFAPAELPAAERPAWKPALAVGLLCLVVYFANGKPQPQVDVVAAPYTAWSLVRHGTLDLSHYPDLTYLVGSHIQETPDGQWLSVRPPGDALAAVPIVAPFAVWREQPFALGIMFHLGKAMGAGWVAGAAVVFFLLCRRLAPAARWPATVLFAFGSCLWSVASQASWMHGPATFWICLALYLLLPARNTLSWQRATMAGLSLGLALLTRPTTVFFVPAAMLALAIDRRWRCLLGLSLAAALPLALYTGINLHYFHDPFLGGYSGHSVWQTPTPYWLGISGLLVSPSRGLLVYSPALLLVPLGLRALGNEERYRPYRVMVLTWLLASLATVVLYGRWGDWWGGWCYGPRFLCETMPLWCLLFALAYEELSRWWLRGAAQLAKGLVALAVLIHFVGIAGHGVLGDWQTRHAREDQGRCFFELRDNQIEAHARQLWRKLTGRRQATARPRPPESTGGTGSATAAPTNPGSKPD